MTTCMGGWCHLRDKCKNHEPSPHQPVVERLCAKGDFDAFEPPAVIRPIAWERTPALHLAPMEWAA